MVERDCSTCIYHSQAAPVDSFCFNCLIDPTLPRWEPEGEEEELHEEHIPLSDYVQAVYDRDTGESVFEMRGSPNQSRKESLVKSLLNTLSGFILSYLVWVLVASPLFNIPVNYTESFWITCLFTGVSVVRSYVWRRLFNNRRLVHGTF